MSREIKFRVWNKETQVMLDWESIVRFKNLNKLIALNHVDVMQYTGLKDKNDVEIYEGDIIKNPLTGSIGVIEYDHEDCAYKVVFDVGGFNNFMSQQTEFEVIGNKYENLELLTT